MNRSVLLLFLAITLGASPVHGFEWNPPCVWELDLTKEQKLIALNAGSLAFISLWGLAFWNYGQRSPHLGNEQWFERGTPHGGADKAGHMYTNIYLTEGLSYFYERWGFTHNEAALYGAISSFVVTGYTEIGDSFSKYGFSYEDFVMNTVGSIIGYFHYKYPEFSRKIDFRIEYVPNLEESDILTDYEHQKYVVALLLDGFDCMQKNPLKYLELQMGYYTRGYTTQDIDKHRYFYAAIGLNLSKIFSDLGYPKFGRVFNYYQVPYTYVHYKKDVN